MFPPSWHQLGFKPIKTQVSNDFNMIFAGIGQDDYK